MLQNKILKITISLFTIVAALVFTSCEKDVIDLSPVDKLDDITAYETPERCELSVIGAYDAIQCGLYNDSYSRGYPFGAASIIQGEMRGEDMNLTAVFYDITYSSTYTPSTANNQYFWEASFEAINRINTVIKGIEGAIENNIISEEKGKSYKGELLFLRALTYHTLLLHFAYPVNVDANNNYGLPLYLTAINTPAEIEEALKIGRSSVTDTYAQILKDLNDAESSFSGNDKNSVNGITRASKGSVIALKTRVYLHKRDWDNVISEAKKLVPGTTAPFESAIGGYKLEASPATPFLSFASNTESIFSVENSADDEASVNGAMAAMMSARPSGRAIVTSSPTLYNTSFWLADDKRRDLLYYSSAYDYYYCDKYRNVQTRDEYAPIMRYAEVLLNYSEAVLRKGGNDALALELLNAVRNRSLATPATQAYTASNFATKKAFLDAILWERRIEFHGEGRRWEDIQRLANDDLSPSGGIPAKIDYARAKGKANFVVGGEVKPAWFSPSRPLIPYSDKRFLWPIPVNDLVRNPTLAAQQNAGWSN
ncbi:RagB/SusD family nutrient uptake outer membrane protein [Dysgonomonas sp. GY75]|uniref:RagB/SusD family nutrient uptake outer membrane protein n=1 Tax=Dysgonomonas sp. GY75 TaxID=2780419 RepID=UPI001883E47C|nr:RagB/SusD family nutrient uptake outer membrane protein [Dysgonomonas sp. GY75]MBF0648576.1 RagB/SusD family nutrient uptake outer membrane protein [Dysgonomonas sp. GY75]